MTYSLAIVLLCPGCIASIQDTGVTLFSCYFCRNLCRYDPVHYGVPEGSYSTAPDGALRILEYREMVQVRLHTY